MCKSLLICCLSAIYQRLSFSLNPTFLGQASFLWSPVISCKGPFSSSLPCSVSGALSSDPLVSLLCFLIYLDNFLGINKPPVHVSGKRWIQIVALIINVCQVYKLDPSGFTSIAFLAELQLDYQRITFHFYWSDFVYTESIHSGIWLQVAEF